MSVSYHNLCVKMSASLPEYDNHSIYYGPDWLPSHLT